MNSLIKKNKIIFCLALIFAFGAGGAQALLPENGLAPMNLSGGARELGMGGAVFAKSERLDGIYYNPAVISRAFGLEVGNSRDGIVGFSEAFPLDPGNTWGFSFVNSNISKTNSLGQPVTLQSNTVIGTYSQRLAYIPFFQENPYTENLTFGMNLKALLNSDLDVNGAAVNGNGAELDLGLLFEPKNPFSFGVAATNLVPAGSPLLGTITWNDGSTDGIPAKINTGAALKIIGDRGMTLTDGDMDLVAQLGAQIPIKEGQEIGNANFGFEYSRRDTWYFRAGLNNRGAAVGVSLRNKEWGGDLAYYDSSSVAFTFSYYPEAWRFKEKLIPETDGILVDLSPDKKQFVTNESFAVVSGKIKAEYRLTVNGNLVYQDKENNFSTFVPLNLGKNLIRVVGRSEWEKQTAEYKILRRAKVLVEEEDQITAVLATINPEIDRLTAQVLALSVKADNARTEKARKPLLKQMEKVSKDLDVLEARKNQLLARQKEIQDQKESAENLVSLGILDDTSGKKIQLDRNITRGEFAVLVAKSSGQPVQDVYEPVFKDVPPADPNAPYIKLVKDLGLMKALDGNNFYPDRVVTNKEGKEVFSKLGALQY
jgi:hypothetical protein